jgi:HAD superfamily hydrolase (TIGR01509 family)
MTFNQRQIEAVIFDLDDTLIDWADAAMTWQEFARPRTDKVHHYLIDRGHILPQPDAFYGIVDMAMFETWEEAKKTYQIQSISQMLLGVFERLGLDISQIDMNEVLRVYNWGPLPGVKPFPDTKSVLLEIRQRGYKVGLLTNSFLPMWMRDVELDAYELMEFLDARVTAADVGCVKPHPDIYHRMLEMLQTEPDRAVFVGDRPKYDIAGANGVGLISVLMDPPHLTRDLEGIQPDYTISCLTELLPILEKLEAEI